MFQITQQYVGGEIRHAVVGEVGHQLVTVLATSEMQACEIARCLNEAASVEIEDLTEIVSADNLHQAMDEILRRQEQLGGTLDEIKRQYEETALRG